MKTLFNETKDMSLPELEKTIITLFQHYWGKNEEKRMQLETCFHRRERLLWKQFECTPENVERLHCVANQIKDLTAMLHEKGNRMYQEMLQKWQANEKEDFTDFCERVSSEKVNKKCIESLIKAGCFDSLGQTRATLLASFESILDTISNLERNTLKGQVNIFDIGGAGITEVQKYNYKTLPELEKKEMLVLEKEMLGIYLSGHPLDDVREELQKQTNINSKQLMEAKTESQMKYGGIITSVKKKFTKNNTTMAFITVEDIYGAVEIIVFDSCYQTCSNILEMDNIIVIDGRISIREEEATKIVAREIRQLNVLHRVARCAIPTFKIYSRK